MNARDKAAIRVFVEGIPVLLGVGLVTNATRSNWPIMLAGLAAVVAAVVAGHRLWPSSRVISSEADDTEEELPRDTRSDRIALFITVGVTMMIAIWVALRLTK